MNQSVFVAICLLVLACLVQGNSIQEPELKSAMSEAYLRGISKFGGQPASTPRKEYSAEATPEPKKPKIFSQYTAGLKALGGGKPRLNDQYRHHNYTPLAPSVIPFKHPVMANKKLTPEIAAEIYKPQRPLQYTSDIQ